MIPIFLSTPNALAPEQQEIKNLIVRLIDEEGLVPRTVGATDMPIQNPLREAAIIARACYGGVILGFEQGLAPDMISRRGTNREAKLQSQKFPTPWNHLEAGMLYALRKPLLILKQSGVDGGIFDHGVSEAFITAMPDTMPSDMDRRNLRAVVKSWATQVVTSYRHWG